MDTEVRRVASETVAASDLLRYDIHQNFLTKLELAGVLKKTGRTLGRWDALRIGPPQSESDDRSTTSEVPSWNGSRRTSESRGGVGKNKPTQGPMALGRENRRKLKCGPSTAATATTVPQTDRGRQATFVAACLREHSRNFGESVDVLRAATGLERYSSLLK